MDILKKIKDLQEIHPFIVLTQDVNTPGEYIFFNHIKPNKGPDFIDYVFDIYFVRNKPVIDDLIALQKLLNKLLKIQYDYFKVLDGMKPLKLGDNFVIYKIPILVNEQFDINYAKELLKAYDA